MIHPRTKPKPTWKRKQGRGRTGHREGRGRKASNDADSGHWRAAKAFRTLPSSGRGEWRERETGRGREIGGEASRETARGPPRPPDS